MQTWVQLVQIYQGGPAILINYDGKIEFEPAKVKRDLTQLKHIRIVNHNYCNSDQS